MTQRNDIHSPKNLVTEDYEYVTSFDTGTSGWAASDWAKEIIGKVNANPITGDRGMCQCHHCGSWLRYVAVLEHTPTGTYIATGETCVNRFDLATTDFQAMRKAAALDAKKNRIRGLVAEFTDANPDLVFMGIKKFDDRKLAMPEASACNSFIHDVARRLNQYGSISDKQVAAIRKSVVKDVEFAAAKAAKEQAKADAPSAGAVPAGKKVDISGTVISRKWKINPYGYSQSDGSFKLTVELANGSRIWFTEPSTVVDVNGVRVWELAKGDEIQCRLSVVTASDKDESFGFGKRPTRFVYQGDATATQNDEVA